VIPTNASGVTISVAITTYNHVAYLRQALESVIAQETSYPFEVVVLDDCSTDGTSEIVSAYSRSFPDRIRAIVHPRNHGALASALELLQEVRGEYVALLEGDDYWIDSTKLQTQVTFLETHRDFVLCGHNCVIRNEWTGSERLFREWDHDVTLTVRHLIDFPMPTASMLFRNGLISEWPPSLVAAGFGDRPLALMLSQLGSVQFLKQAMSVYRVHAGGAWSGRHIVDPYAPVHETTEDGLRKLVSYWEALRDYLNHEHDDRISELVQWADSEIDRQRSRARYAAHASPAPRADE
jgi:glycosyltransferase involved in cell wall biosynthesis